MNDASQVTISIEIIKYRNDHVKVFMICRKGGKIELVLKITEQSSDPGNETKSIFSNPELLDNHYGALLRFQEICTSSSHQEDGHCFKISIPT